MEHHHQQHHSLSSQETYNPNQLLDTLRERMKLKNDAALSRALEVAPPVISKIRHRTLPVGASLLGLAAGDETILPLPHGRSAWHPMRHSRTVSLPAPHGLRSSPRGS